MKIKLLNEDHIVLPDDSVGLGFTGLEKYSDLCRYNYFFGLFDFSDLISIFSTTATSRTTSTT